MKCLSRWALLLSDFAVAECLSKPHVLQGELFAVEVVQLAGIGGEGELQAVGAERLLVESR